MVDADALALVGLGIVALLALSRSSRGGSGSTMSNRDPVSLPSVSTPLTRGERPSKSGPGVL